MHVHVDIVYKLKIKTKQTECVDILIFNKWDNFHQNKSMKKPQATHKIMFNHQFDNNSLVPIQGTLCQNWRLGCKQLPDINRCKCDCKDIGNTQTTQTKTTFPRHTHLSHGATALTWRCSFLAQRQSTRGLLYTQRRHRLLPPCHQLSPWRRRMEAIASGRRHRKSSARQTSDRLPSCSWLCDVQRWRDRRSMSLQVKPQAHKISVKQKKNTA